MAEWVVNFYARLDPKSLNVLGASVLLRPGNSLPLFFTETIFNTEAYVHQAADSITVMFNKKAGTFVNVRICGPLKMLAPTFS